VDSLFLGVGDMGWENALRALVPLELDVTKDTNLEIVGLSKRGRGQRIQLIRYVKYRDSCLRGVSV
jgi:hypothetical protein